MADLARSRERFGRRGSAAVALVAAVAFSACASSTYRMRHRDLLVEEVHDGMPVLRRGERTFNNQPIGGGLSAAVAGVPHAEALAQASSQSMIAFLLSYLGGLSAIGVGAGALAIGGLDEASDGNVMQFGGGAIAAVGAVAVGASFWFASRSVALRSDAINAYNDAVLERLRVRLEPLPPLAQPMPADASATGD